MSDGIAAFISDCTRHSDLEFVRKNFSGFPPELLAIVRDPKGEQVLETGVGLFRYLADLVNKRGEQALQTWLVPMLGYPNHEHTDLISPYYDVSRTQHLWYNATDHLKTPTPEIKAELILNVYFRWYISAIELMRKALTFAAYCRSQQLGKLSGFPYSGLLYRGKDPIKHLQHLDPSGNVAIVTQFYKNTLRHALAHGNAVITIPHLIAVRLRASETTGFGDTEESSGDRFTENVYPIGSGTTTVDSQRIVDDFQMFADPCYQSFRVFNFLYLAVHNQHLGLIKRQWPQNYQNQTLGAIVASINDDPDGLRYWKAR